MEEKEIILKNAENCKIALSNAPTYELNIETKKIKGHLSVTRTDLVNICGSLLGRIKNPALTADEILADEIVLVGGRRKIKKIKDFIAHILGKEPLFIREADETVAIGVGIYAGIKDRNEDFDVCFIYDLNGILNIEVTLVATGVMRKMTLLSSNNSKKLTEAEKTLQLAKVKKKSKEDEQMQFMIETANAMYAQTIGDMRQLLDTRTREFSQSMKNQSKIKKVKSLKLFAEFLNSIAETIAYNPLSNDIDVSWYKEEE